MGYIKLFTMDDVEVSGAGVFTNAVQQAAEVAGEGTPVELYALADTGYVVNDTLVTPTGTEADKWACAPDSGGAPGAWGAWGDPINLGAVDDTTGVPFWCKAKAEAGETPAVDDSVTLLVTGTASAE